MSQYSFLLLCLLASRSAAWLTVNPRCIPASRHGARWMPLRLNADNDNDWDDTLDESSLQLELKEKIAWDDSGDKIPLLQSNPRKEKRDLFIPIFALISLAGLFGTYAYEMWRLASKGELYLPWT